MFPGELDRGDEGLGHAVVRILDDVDRTGDRGEEALSLSSHQRPDQVIAARVAALGRHSGYACSADHLFDRNPLQPNGSCFLKRGVHYALARGRPTRPRSRRQWRENCRQTSARSLRPSATAVFMKQGTRAAPGASSRSR